MPEHRRLVIIGAGIVGCSAAYHLAELGWEDILVLDQGPLFETGGSTSHAPGIVFGTNPSHTMSRFAQYSVKLFNDLTYQGERCWYPVGCLEVAESEARMREILRRSGYNTGYGMRNETLNPQEIQTLVPLIDPGAIQGGMFVPDDGVGKAWKLAGALAERAAKDGAVEFRGGTAVQDIVLENGRVTAVVTDQGRLYCEQVLLCTNIWGSVLADKVGVDLPFMACAHHYALTEPLPELAGETRWTAYPAVRHQDRAMYFRHWGESWCTGSYRHEPRIVSPYQVGKDAYWAWRDDDFEVAIEDAAHLFPALRGRRYIEKVNGMFVFSVDGFPIMGPTEVPGFWVSIGIWVTHSGGAGKTIAEWMTRGTTEWDPHEIDVARFHEFQKKPAFVTARSAQNYREVYDIIHPLQQMERPRGLRKTPFHEHLKKLEAVFFASAGWERPQWYAANRDLLAEFEGRIPERRGWEVQNWSPIQGAEHLATRERAGLFELGAFTKIEVSGPGALGYLERLCANRIDRPVGKVVYTSMLNESGGIVCDLTVTRLARERFWVLTGGGSGPHDLAWMRRHLPGDVSVHLADVSSQYTALGLWGPRAREILAPLVPEDISNTAFPYYSARSLSIGEVPAYALRVSYAGELGWEIYTPTEYGAYLWQLLWDAGRPHGLAAAGMGAFDSLRLEKGYRLWGQDIDPESNPIEAGLDWAVRSGKGEFIGRRALEQIREQGVRRKLCCMVFTDRQGMALGKEPIFAGDRAVGYVTSTNYGYSLGVHILYGYLPLAHAEPGGELEVAYFGKRYPAVVVEEPLFDPGMARMRG